MPIRLIVTSLFLVLASVSSVRAQSGTVVVTLDEGFFGSLLEAVFKDGNTVNFAGTGGTEASAASASSGPSPAAECDETVRLHREINGRQTSLRLRDGRIFMPVAFSGAYAPPLIGCIDYSGVADTEISLDFDPSQQSLVGKVKVTNVDLNGTRGVGGTLIAKFVQRSIDEKINPIQILGLNSVSFGVPVQGANVTMRAVRITHEIAGGVIAVRITYDFVRS